MRRPERRVEPTSSGDRRERVASLQLHCLLPKRSSCHARSGPTSTAQSRCAFARRAARHAAHFFSSHLCHSSRRRITQVVLSDGSTFQVPSAVRMVSKTLQLERDPHNHPVYLVRAQRHNLAVFFYYAALSLALRVLFIRTSLFLSLT